MPSLGLSAMVTLTITTVSPHLTTQEPLVCSAYLPISTVTSLPPISVLNSLNFCAIFYLSYSLFYESFRTLFSEAAENPAFFFTPDGAKIFPRRTSKTPYTRIFLTGNEKAERFYIK